MLRTLTILLSAALLLSSCKRNEDDGIAETPTETEGWAPIYATNSTIRSIAAQPTVHAGKIYIKGKTLYQVETGKGIHVIDIATPTAPKKKGFIEVGGCSEISIQGNLLYTNNLNDLVVVDITDVSNASEAGRVANTFQLNNSRPPGSGWSECIDPSKGTIVAWERKTLYHPNCMF